MENIVNQKKKIAKRYIKKQKIFKVEKFCHQIRQGPIPFVVCQQYLHKRNVRLFELEKYHILDAELYCPVRSFDEKIHICSTCHEHLSRNEMPLSNSLQ